MVQLAPERTLDPGRFLDYEHSVKSSRLVDRALAVIDRPGLSVCDIGGASGVFLAELARRSPHPIQATVLDVGDYRERLVDPKIEFIQASIVENQVEAGRFDLVTARHVFHHLVGASLGETRALQQRALREMVRITRPGGYLLIEEEVNRVPAFSRLVYYLSRFASQHRIRLRFFETGRVVVSFMSPEQLAEAVASAAQSSALDVIETEYQPRSMQWRWRLTLLMADVGNQLYVIRKGAARARQAMVRGAKPGAGP